MGKPDGQGKTRLTYRTKDSIVVSCLEDLEDTALVDNMSSPLQTLNGESQQKADDLQLETSGRHRMDLPRKHSSQVTENRLDVLASGLAQELLPRGHRPLGSLLTLGLEVQ